MKYNELTIISNNKRASSCELSLQNNKTEATSVTGTTVTETMLMIISSYPVVLHQLVTSSEKVSQRWLTKLFSGEIEHVLQKHKDV